MHVETLPIDNAWGSSITPATSVELNDRKNPCELHPDGDESQGLLENNPQRLGAGHSFPSHQPAFTRSQWYHFILLLGLRYRDSFWSLLSSCTEQGHSAFLFNLTCNDSDIFALPGNAPSAFVHPIPRGKRFYMVAIYCAVASLLFADQNLMAPNLTCVLASYTTSACEME